MIPRPNIVLIVTDDQRADSLRVMPRVSQRLVGHGVKFRNSFVVNPICGPSRVAGLTGQFAHTNGIYRNLPPHGGFQEFDDSSTIATWLHAGGYTTAMFGKYLHGYVGTYIPPGWDRWGVFQYDTEQMYFDYKLNVDGTIRTYGRDPDEYSTDVLGKMARQFIFNTDGPLFLYFSPRAPHGGWIPAPRHANAFPNLKPWRPRSYNEQYVRDKPKYIRDIPRFSEEQMAKLDQFRRASYQTLLSVDEAVGGILDALIETDRITNTLIVYTSDNGYSWGEHRWAYKEVPYRESIRVPMVVRFDRVFQGKRTGTAVVGNIDIAPTLAHAAGVPAPGVDGRSFLPLITKTATNWRRELLIEHLLWEGAAHPVPTYCALRSAGHLYVSYETGEQELYDLRADPQELRNIAGRQDAQTIVTKLRGRLREMCAPRPPGYPANLP